MYYYEMKNMNKILLIGKEYKMFGAISIDTIIDDANKCVSNISSKNMMMKYKERNDYFFKLFKQLKSKIYQIDKMQHISYGHIQLDLEFSIIIERGVIIKDRYYIPEM